MQRLKPGFCIEQLGEFRSLTNKGLVSKFSARLKHLQVPVFYMELKTKEEEPRDELGFLLISPWGSTER